MGKQRKDGSNAGADASCEQAHAPKLATPQFILITVANFAVFLSFQMTTVGLPLYVARLGGSALEVGLVTTLLTVSALIMRPVTGYVVDRFGSKGTMLSGMAIACVTIASYALVPIVGVILVIRVLQGLGWGMCSTSTSSLVAQIIPRKRFAEGMGFYTAGTSVGQAIGPALAVSLMENGDASTMIATATFASLVGFSLSLFLKDARGKKAREKETEKKPFSLGDFFDRHAFFPAVLILLCNAGFACVTSFIVLLAEERGVEGVAVYFVVYALTTIVTRPLIGRVVDSRGYRFGAPLGALGTAFTLVFIAFSSNLLMFCLAGVFAGIGVGTAMSVYQSMAVSSVKPERKGVATSTYFTAFDLGMGLGALSAGAAVSAFGYSGAFACMTAFPLLACAVSVLGYRSWSGKYER